MKKGEFNLEGKAIDCSGLPDLDDAGKEIFKALKVACNGSEHPPFTVWSNVGAPRGTYLIINGAFKMLASTSSAKSMDLKIIQPSDVLGQAAIDASMDGATIVFEGDNLPFGKVSVYYGGGDVNNFLIDSPSQQLVRFDTIAYKLLHEKPRHRIQIEPMHVKLGMKKDEFDKVLRESLSHEQPSIESRVLAEKVGFKELCPVCSPKEWADREAESYDDLRDAHLELVRDSMEKDKEIELLKQRIKDMHRAMNDAKAVLDV